MQNKIETVIVKVNFIKFCGIKITPKARFPCDNSRGFNLMDDFFHMEFSFFYGNIILSLFLAGLMMNFNNAAVFSGPQ